MIALLAVWLAAIASPGPDLFQIIRVGSKSRRAGVLCALGIMVGNTVWITASALGLGAISDQALRVLQVVGGLYLMYMGIGAVRAGLKPAETRIGTAVTVRRPFLTGVLTNLSNPKALLFFAAIFSQFRVPGAVPLLIITGVVWFMGVAVAVDKLKRPIERYGHLIDLVTGAIFIGLAVWMIAYR